MPGSPLPDLVAFGPFEVDRESGELRRRGRRIRLDDKAFQVLNALVERPGRLVTREALVERLWRDDVFVEFDRSLNNAVGRVREALGDSASRPRYIETLPKKGYRFIAAVEVRAAAPGSQDARPDGDGAVQAVGAAAARRSWPTYVLAFTIVLLVGGFAGYAWATRNPGSVAPVAAEVQEAYLLGRHYLGQGSEPSLHRARQLFQQAIDRDPHHAPSYAGLADVYTLTDALAPAVALPKAKAYAQRALELDESLAAAHTSLGYARYFGDWDWAGAEQAFGRALALNPNETRALRWYATVLGTLGRFEQARIYSRRAVQLEPTSIVTLDATAAGAFRAREHDQGLLLARRILELAPSDARGFEHLAANHAQRREFADCGAAAAQGAALTGRAAHFVALEAYCLGRSQRAHEAALRLAELEQRARHAYVPCFFRAVAAVGAGRFDEAIGLLERGFAERDNYMVELKTSPWLDPIRADARVGRLIAAMAFP